MAARFSKKIIVEDLEKQLREKGKNTPYLQSLIADYGECWETKRKLAASIRKKGISYEATSSTGKKYEKDNPAVKLIPVYLNTLMTILQKLGLQDPEQEEEDRL